jgi:hypothetical protein
MALTVLSSFSFCSNPHPATDWVRQATSSLWAKIVYQSKAETIHITRHWPSDRQDLRYGWEPPLVFHPWPPAATGGLQGHEWCYHEMIFLLHMASVSFWNWAMCLPAECISSVNIYCTCSVSIYMLSQYTYFPERWMNQGFWLQVTRLVHGDVQWYWCWWRVDPCVFFYLRRRAGPPSSLSADWVRYGSWISFYILHAI